MNAMREDFEAWAKVAAYDVRKGGHGRDPDDYRFTTTDCAWQAWQAARQPVDPEHGHIDPSWSLHDRVEFALRDAGFDLDEAAFVAEAADRARRPVGEVVAYVPVHPRQGPLWSDTLAAGSEVHRSNSYPLMRLYAAPPQQPERVEYGRWSQRHAEDLKEAIHTALSAHAGALSQKKRDSISDFVKRILIDRQGDGNG